MRFHSRETLAEQFVHRLADFRGKEVVIVPLTDSSVSLACGLAARLRGWVYPMVTSTVTQTQPLRRDLGLYMDDGSFIAVDKLETPDKQLIDAQKQTAMESVRQRWLSYEMHQNTNIFSGRPVIFVCDVLTSRAHVMAAEKIIVNNPVSGTACAIGNLDVNLGEYVQRVFDATVVMDVVTNESKHVEQYFELPDEYTADQYRAIVKNIRTYWQ